MKYLKTYEENKYQLNVGDYVRIKGSDKIGIILSIIKGKKLLGVGIIRETYMVEIKGECSVYIKNELEKLTPEEKELYVNTNKYNL